MSGHVPIFEEVILLLGWFKNRLAKEEYKVITDKVSRGRGTIDQRILTDLKVIKGKMERDDGEV